MRSVIETKIWPRIIITPRRAIEDHVERLYICGILAIADENGLFSDNFSPSFSILFIC